MLQQCSQHLPKRLGQHIGNKETPASKFQLAERCAYVYMYYIYHIYIYFYFIFYYIIHILIYIIILYIYDVCVNML